MRSRHPRYRYRRRRGPERSTVLGILVLALAVAAGAFVISVNSGGDPGPSAATAATGAAHHRHRAGGDAPSHGTQSGEGPAARAASREVDAALRRSSFVVRGIPRRRVVALTFDDGPGPYTPAILRILVRMHAPATFFVVGQELKDFAGAVRFELRHGFVIGDHTQNHAWLVHLSPSGQAAQISAVASGMQRLGAPAPRLFRPPYGAFNQVTLAALRRMRMFMVLWSVDPGDWRRPGSQAIVANVLANARPGGVVIMHDGGGDRSQTVAALPAIINGLRRRHYGLVTVPRLLALDPPPRHQSPPRLSGV